MIFALYCKTPERNQNVPNLRGDVIVMMASFIHRKTDSFYFAGGENPGNEVGEILAGSFRQNTVKPQGPECCLCFGKFLEKS